LAYSPTHGPLHGDPALISGTTYGAITFTGDPTMPSFQSDGKLRLYLRRPLGHRNINTSTQPYTVAAGHGSVFVEASGDNILYHSTSFDPINLLGDYGNFAPVTPGAVYPSLVNPLKDSYEAFLDEVYRYERSFPAAIDTLFGAGAKLALDGPGMSGWVGGPIETPVQISSVVTVNWSIAGFVRTGRHLIALPGGQLQVTGVPDRNPPLYEGNKYPFPSAGLLMYPQKDYSVGYRPDAVDLGGPQHDYSGYTLDRRFIRCFDASLGGTVNAVGTPFVLLRIDGLELQEYRYVAPGPGAYGTTGIYIFMKVPGLTTWMDIGRVDGAGPSKQDALLDGAGCLIIGPETLDGVDPETGMVFSQVKLNVGPIAQLFTMTGIDGAEAGKVPVLVKVIMADTAKDYNLEKEYDPNTQTFVGSPSAGVPAGSVRGLVGIRIVDPAHPFGSDGLPT